MKQTVKYAFATLGMALLSMSTIWAVAPLPGLGLTEPVRQPMTQGVVNQQRQARVAAEWQAPISENEDHGIRSQHFMGNRWGNSVRLYFSGLQNHCR